MGADCCKQSKQDEDIAEAVATSAITRESEEI